MKRRFRTLSVLLLLISSLPLLAQDLSSYEKRVSVKTLPNGLTVLIWRRPEAPVFSFFTMVDAGSAQDPKNKTGLAHMMEHMAFKGTPDIGTTDYAAEKVALAEGRADLCRVRSGAHQARRAGSEEAGAVEEGLAGSHQRCRPIRHQEPVWQDCREPRRSGRERLHQLRRDRLHVFAARQPDRAVGCSGVGSHAASRDARVLQRAQRGDGRAPHAHRQPADRTTGGAVPRHGLHGESVSSSDDRLCFATCSRSRRPMRRSFFKQYYVPSNMVIALVGDLDPAKVFPIVGAYFGQLPAAPSRTSSTPLSRRRTRCGK